MSGRGYEAALQSAGILAVLAQFDPHVAGTPPLGLDMPGSDIDILCHAPDAGAFARAVWAAFAEHAGFAMHQWTSSVRPVIASFRAEGWEFEIFGDAVPVREQAGWRHFMVERRLLALGGEGFRTAVMQARSTGMKTEPAVAAVLGLGGDPYAALLMIEDWEDERLIALLRDGL
ncbi:MAG: DUF4269 domain-containing protein [Sphingobium sp.]